MTRKILFIGAMTLWSMFAMAGAHTNKTVRVVPAARNVEMKKGAFKLPSTYSYYIKGDVPKGLSAYLQTLPEKFASAQKISRAQVFIHIKGGKDGDESYRLIVAPRQIKIEANTETGAFYAVQTLLQMAATATDGLLACCTIDDEPRFRYRGLLFDVSRHFRSKEFLKKQMDAMALLKLNRMHLHLTDGAGWRIQMDRYPRLTSFAAWRPNKTWMEWTKNGNRYCEQSQPGAYGGYYTKADIKEILEYARQRHITVIPEIEMPGHSEEVLAAYPELSCSGKPYVNSDFCAGKEETFQFLENVLTEVMNLFPSKYIHIGGDEATKEGWKTCADCRRRMQTEGLDNVDRLQSYFIHRIEKFVNSKGRQIIGYDEILEGGLAPNATVMSWRGTKGGVKAMKDLHDVVMCPVEYYYLDYTQDAPFKEPVSIGGYTPLKTVYDYEPLEPGLTTEEAGHLLGVQGNLWSEYITEDSHAEYMYYPRAFAVAETGWSRPENKNYDRFREQAVALVNMLSKRGYHTFDLEHEYGERRESLQSPINHLAKGCKVSYTLPYHEKYAAAGPITLTDGLLGGWTYRDNRWQGTLDNMDVTIDLGTVKPVHYVGATFMHSAGAWVHVPEKVEYFLSEDGKNFTSVATLWNDIATDDPQLLFKQYAAPLNGKARYVRMKATKNPREGAWLFTDEIVVN